MDRIPEPELMNDPAQAYAYAHADFTEPHQAFVDRFRTSFAAHRPEHVLDLGCGSADVTIRFARAYSGSRITGIDGAEAMLSEARAAVDRAQLDSRIALVHARLPELHFTSDRFDTIISNSLLHHLADARILWETIRATAATGAAVFIMDLLRPGSRDEAQSLVATYAAQEPEILKRDFFHSLLAAYRPEEIRAQLALADLAHLRVEIVSDRHCLVYGNI